MKGSRSRLFLDRCRRSGFALAAALMLSVLLIVLALGLLTLSSVSLRSGSTSAAKHAAMANARLALSLAIGQLQKAAGPDQRISAPAGLLFPPSHPGRTGIWESCKLSPQGDSDLADRKRRLRRTPEADGEFVTWLESSSWSKASGPEALPEAPDGIPLFPAQAGGNVFSAQTIGLPDGCMAWAAVDESVKTRFDLPVEDEVTLQESHSRLRAPGRHAPETLDGLDGLRVEASNAAGFPSVAQGALAVDRETFGRYTNDLTVWSASLPVNVADGGLKVDLTRAFAGDSLPPELAGRHLYSGSTEPLLPADPMLSTLADWYRLHRLEGDPSLQTSLPRDYKPVIKRYDSASRSIISSPHLAAPDGLLVAPVVTRVQVVFSLVVREAHEPWYGALQGVDPQLKYMLYLIYTPAITLYNPYNQPLSVKDLKVAFKHLPLAFQFYRNGNAETQRPALLSQLHGLYENRDDWEDEFVARLSSTPGSPGHSSITLSPGESRIFGLNHPPGTTWPSMLNFIWQSGQTSKTRESLFPGSGWDYRGGFIVDVLRPQAAGRNTAETDWYILPLRGTDQIDVACSLRPPAGGKVSQFGIEISANVEGTESLLGVYQYQYRNAAALEAALGGDHPSLGKIEFPFRRERPWLVSELYQRRSDSDPVETWTGPKPFAVFSLAARTALDSLHPGKPVRENSFVHHVLDLDLSRTHPGTLPLEASFLPILNQSSGTAGSIETAADGSDRVYHHTGVRADTGVLDYPIYEIPRHPPVNLASLRHAHLAGSGHLPAPAYTIGESFAHPMLPSDRALLRESPAGYDLADHSWLANHALWDAFYFSGIRDETDAANFFDGERLPLVPRFQSWRGGGEERDSFLETVTGPDSWRHTAARQMLEGGFNVNSTSVAAWRALLSSCRRAQVPFLDRGSSSETFASSSGVPFPRLLPAAKEETGPWSEDLDRSWRGFRSMSDEQISRLAETIVATVRERGPFLSMSEFVNRRLGVDDASMCGVLQAAMDAADLHRGPIPGGRPIALEDVSSFGYQNPRAATGDALDGGQASLTQGDLLSGIGAGLVVRADTFLLRAYGDARDADGNILARAWCEAVLQRVPEFVDPSDPSDRVFSLLGTETTSGETLSDLNQRFGRRFRMAAFRWLTPAEIQNS